MPPSPKPLTTRTFQFACHIVKIYCQLTRVPAFPFHVARQLLRAGTSIGANIEEAKAAGTDPELLARSIVALREARETKFWLRLIKTTELAKTVSLEWALDEADQLVAILTVWVRKVRQRVSATQQAQAARRRG